MQSMALITLASRRADDDERARARAQCDNSNVTGIADRLEAAGLVERRPAEHDRRVKTLVLTRRRASGVRARSSAG